MTAEQIAVAFATIAEGLKAGGQSPEQEDQCGAAAIALATQVVVDLHRIADAAEQLALQRTTDALGRELSSPEGQDAQPLAVGVYVPLPDGRSIPVSIRAHANPT